MPWHIGKHGSCPVSKPFAVIKDADGSSVGCHPSREAAQRHLAALNINVEETMSQVKIHEQRPSGAFRDSQPRSGRREAVLIEAGWGSSGYYAEEVLSEFGPVAWPQGTHMYLDHPTLQEEVDRPERSVKDWVGSVAATPRMAGIQLVSEVEIFDHWKPVIESIGDKVGLSVVAPAVMEHGDAGGRHGPIVKEIHHSPINSVDYVTIAGAGGRLGQLIESARGIAGEPTDEEVKKLLEAIGDDEGKLQVFISDAQSLLKEKSEESSGGKQEKESDMETEELQRKLSEAESRVTQLESDAEESKTKLSEAHRERDEQKDRADRAEDALLVSGAKTVAREAVEQIDGLPQRAVERIVESAVRGELPKDEQGKLITEKVKETALAKAREELEYLAGEKLEGDLPIRESGSTSTTTTTTTNGGNQQDEEKLVESFRAAGLSEEAAKIAAKGR